MNAPLGSASNPIIIDPSDGDGSDEHQALSHHESDADTEILSTPEFWANAAVEGAGSPSPQRDILGSRIYSHPNRTIDPASLEKPQKYITDSMLRQNTVPWRVSAAQPAVLFSETKHAGPQCLEIQSFKPSAEVDNIDCLFCIGDDADDADERVILRCERCSNKSHLCCILKWLEKRETGYGTSCCVW